MVFEYIQRLCNHHQSVCEIVASDLGKSSLRRINRGGAVIKELRNNKDTDWEKVFAKDTFDKKLLPKVNREPLGLNNKKTT